MAHEHLSINQFKLFKNGIGINFVFALLRHYVTFYAGAYNPSFMQQIIRPFWSKPHHYYVCVYCYVKARTKDAKVREALYITC